MIMSILACSHSLRRAKVISLSRMIMNPNSQALLDVLAGFDAYFVAALEQQQVDKVTAQ